MIIIVVIYDITDFGLNTSVRSTVDSNSFGTSKNSTNEPFFVAAVLLAAPFSPSISHIFAGIYNSVILCFWSS